MWWRSLHPSYERWAEVTKQLIQGVNLSDHPVTLSHLEFISFSPMLLNRGQVAPLGRY